MEEIVFSDTEIANFNINLARDLLIESYVSVDVEKKKKALILAFRSVGAAVAAMGIDTSKIKRKKEEK